jgi:hypothetical protein
MLVPPTIISLIKCAPKSCNIICKSAGVESRAEAKDKLDVFVLAHSTDTLSNQEKILSMSVLDDQFNSTSLLTFQKLQPP